MAEQNKSPFFRLLLAALGIKQIRAAELLDWSPQRVGYLCSSKCRGFPFDELAHVKQKLSITDSQMMKIQASYFEQNKKK